MLFPKFIIQGENLILGKVQFHKDLLPENNKENLKGDGWFRYDAQTKTFIFSGQSEDFGPAKLEDIKQCVKQGKVFDTVLGRNISDRADFAYDTQTEIINLEK